MKLSERINSLVLRNNSAKCVKKIDQLVDELPYNDLYEVYANLGHLLYLRKVERKHDNGNLMEYSYAELVDLFDYLAEELELEEGTGEKVCIKFLYNYSQLMGHGYGHILEKEQAYSILFLVLDEVGYKGDYSSLSAFLDKTFFS